MPYRTHRPQLVRLALVAALTVLPQPLAAAPDPAEILDQLRAGSVDPSAARRVDGVMLDTGVARLHLEEGVLVPVAGVPGQPVEIVFLGEARVELEPPNEIEAAQLELFTGADELSERFTEAVLVLARDAARESLLARETSALEADEAARARALYASWKEGPERRLLDVEAGLFLDALGDPVYEDYFAAWFRGEELGEFILLVDPESDEQVSLGAFVPLEASEKEKRKIRKRIHAEQRRGRGLALRVEDLGDLDTWMSTSLLTAAGEPVPGRPGFESRHYSLDVEVDPGERTVGGRAVLDLVATTGGRRVVSLTLPSDLVVERVTDGAATSHFFLRTPTEIYAVLPEAPAEGEAVRLAVDYEGVFLDAGEERNWALASGTYWYPHAGLFDRATYDVRLAWPKKYDLVASGRKVEEGEERGMRWERRAIEVPTWAASFEVGRFKIREARGGVDGHVAITLAFDPGMIDRSAATFEEIAQAVADSLTFYEETLGRYPLDTLTVVSVPRAYSQSLLGFITLSNLMMIDWSEFGYENLAALLGFEDRRSVVAHEVAHQWWGHLIGFGSYRDIWITEAMANYSALLWQRRALPPGERPRVGPTHDWQEALLAQLEDGRPIESLGPLVLGPRLESSLGAGYLPIAYQKGAVVLDMMSRIFGEETFLQMLSTLFERLGGRDLTTEDLLDAFERMSGVELDAFGDQFIYGTGLPDVYYDYSFEPLGDGRHRVTIEALQEAPWRYHYEVVERESGRLDVRRSRLDQVEVTGSQLVVPVQIELAPEGGGGKRGKRDEGMTQRILTGRLQLSGERTETSFAIEYEPVKLWLDRERAVFGRFFNRRHQPKRVLFYEGLDRLAANENAAARERFESALATTTPAPEGTDKRSRKAIEDYDELLDARIHVQLARLALDEGRTGDAEDHMDEAHRRSKGNRWFVEDALEILRARLDLLRGDSDSAFKRLRKGVLKREDVDTTEAYVLLAIAAHATGHDEELREALEEAREKGADVGLLDGAAGSGAEG